jgi:hypothetical protein
MGTMVLLRHTLADGSGHFDWMLERGGALLTWRVDEMPGDGALRALRLADHRVAYLWYEGEISGGRGRVARVRAGEAEILEEAPERVCWRGRWEEGDWEKWEATRVDADWTLRRA